MEVRAIGIVDCEEDSVPLDALGLSDSPLEGDGFEPSVPREEESTGGEGNSSSPVVRAAVVADAQLGGSSRLVALDRAKPTRSQNSTPVRSGEDSGNGARDAQAAVRRAAIMTEHGRSRTPD